MFFKILLFTTILLFKSLQGSDLSQWRNAFIQAGKSEALAPNLVVRNLAILSAASFDVLNKSQQNFISYLPAPHLKLPNQWDEFSALRGCSLKLANSLHPSQKSLFSRIAHKTLIKHGEIAHNPSFEYGQNIALHYLNHRRDDGAATKVTYLPQTNPGKWRRTPPYFRPAEQPHWPKVDLFCLPNVKDFIPPPPPEPNGKQYLNAVKEVKLLGGKTSRLRNQKQTQIAKFWKDFSYSSTPPGHWNEIAQSVARKKNFSNIQEAHLFALLNLAMADGGIIAWQSKYHYHLWRPIHAIQYAEEFPKTKTLTDRDWEPLLETPPHPEYISGHACYSGIAAEILSLVLQSDSFSFIVKNNDIIQKPRNFNSFSSCAQEVSNSRLYGGIHYRFSNLIALHTGKKIAQYVHNNFLLPLN
ncbi:MAG: vanadium-dependent haloperoxidase [Opitutales bacterium]